MWMGTSAPSLHQLALARQVQCCLRLGTIRLAPEPMFGGKQTNCVYDIKSYI